MDSIDDSISPPNGEAYEKVELRDGSPLSYVGEKLGMAVEFSHAVYQKLEIKGADNMLNEYGPRESAGAAFRYATTAFLALYNMLGLIDDQNKFKTLEKLSPDKFRTWIAMVQREGSIHG